MKVKKGPRPIPASIRFWRKVLKTENCWVWSGAVSGQGYGNFWDGKKYIRAHAYLLGTVPAGFMYCHNCDNRKCVNPDHIFIGTASDNSMDMVLKGRQSKGEKRHCAKLTESQVVEIRKKYSVGNLSMAALGRKYGVGVNPVWKIIKGITWKHLLSV